MIAHWLSEAKRIKPELDIVDIISNLVRLKKSGSNFVGLCPFHLEKTPSFSVHQSRQFYYCFSCGAKGDVFRFMMDAYGKTFEDAVKILSYIRSGPARMM